MGKITYSSGGIGLAYSQLKTLRAELYPNQSEADGVGFQALLTWLTSHPQQNAVVIIDQTTVTSNNRHRPDTLHAAVSWRTQKTGWW